MGAVWKKAGLLAVSGCLVGILIGVAVCLLSQLGDNDLEPFENLFLVCHDDFLRFTVCCSKLFSV